MKLNAPTILLFLLSLALVIAGLVGHFQTVQYLTEYKFWLVTGGYGLLTIGVLFRGV